MVIFSSDIKLLLDSTSQRVFFLTYLNLRKVEEKIGIDDAEQSLRHAQRVL